MSVQELNELHQRYIKVSDRFKSAWTFHQFLQGLHKLLLEVEFGQHSADFQAVYDLLKEVSKNLNASSVERVNRELDMVERRLKELNRLMVQEDTKVSPSILRLFFQRVRNFNEGVIIQLVKFYLYHYNKVEWTQDYNDKVDFLVTKAAEDSTSTPGQATLREPAKVREMVESLWGIIDAKELSEDVVEMHRDQVDELKVEMTSVESFDDLIQHNLVQHYREYKHGLGQLFFHPDIMTAIVETNIELRNHIHGLYRREEQAIVADYQRIFELEQQVPTDKNLDVELADFREDVEKFEKSLQNESMSLDELGRLRERVRGLVPRLMDIRDGEELFSAPSSGEVAVAVSVDPAEHRTAEWHWQEEEIRVHHQALMEALGSVEHGANPRHAAHSPELFPYRLETREVLAFQQLGEDEGRETDDFILWAASLRSRIQEEVDEIQAILDDTAVTKEAPVFEKARQTTILADRYIRTFEHLLDRAVLDERASDAKDFQVLRMRLVRSNAGLWLLVHRPSGPT